MRETGFIDMSEGRKAKYENEDYDDEQVDALIKYFNMADYSEFVNFMKKVRFAGGQMDEEGPQGPSR